MVSLIWSTPLCRRERSGAGWYMTTNDTSGCQSYMNNFSIVPDQFEQFGKIQSSQAESLTNANDSLENSRSKVDKRSAVANLKEFQSRASDFESSQTWREAQTEGARLDLVRPSSHRQQSLCTYPIPWIELVTTSSTPSQRENAKHFFLTIFFNSILNNFKGALLCLPVCENCAIRRTIPPAPPDERAFRL